MDRRIKTVFMLSSSGIALNNYTLNTQGINKEDIDWLIENNIIKLAKNNKYMICDVDSYLSYGISLLKRSNYKESNLCFKQCYKLDPMNRDAKLQCMRMFLDKGYFDRVFEIYEDLITIEPDKYREENNLYLYLLSVITKLDDKYAFISKRFNESDIMIPGSKTDRLEYDLVKSIYGSKFTYAFKLINDKRNRTMEYSSKDELLHTLLNIVVDSEKRFKKKLFDLAKDDNYKEMITILVDRKRQRKLSRLESFIYIITSAIIDILDKEIFRVPTIYETDDICKAINGYNFELAAELNNKFFINNKETQNGDLLSLLLLKVNALENQTFGDKIDNSEEDERYNNVIKEAEDIANYIRGGKYDLNKYIKRVGLLQRYSLLVRLVYARDYYIEGDYPNGDKMILEVERYSCRDADIIRFLNEVKNNRDNYNNGKNLLIRTKK